MRFCWNFLRSYSFLFIYLFIYLFCLGGGGGGSRCAPGFFNIYIFTYLQLLPVPLSTDGETDFYNLSYVIYRTIFFWKYRKVFCNFLAINLERIMLISGTGKHLLKFANFLACFCWAFEWSEEKKIWIS